ncbi:hypothetical protein ACVWZM_004141 [Bradyrhizobium sp. USDA 4501]
MDKGKKAEQDRRYVDAFPRELEKWLGDVVVEARRDAVGVEGETGPSCRENAGRERSSGNAREAVDGRKQSELVEADQAAEVEEHRAKAATGKADANAVLELLALEDVGDHERRLFGIVLGLIRHWLAPASRRPASSGRISGRSAGPHAMEGGFHVC